MKNSQSYGRSFEDDTLESSPYKYICSQMEQTAAELAILLDGSVSGNPETRVRKLGKIESAGTGAVTFLANKEYEKFVYSSCASVVVAVSYTHLTLPTIYSV